MVVSGCLRFYTALRHLYPTPYIFWAKPVHFLCPGPLGAHSGHSTSMAHHVHLELSNPDHGCQYAGAQPVRAGNPRFPLTCVAASCLLAHNCALLHTGTGPYFFCGRSCNRNAVRCSELVTSHPWSLRLAFLLYFHFLVSSSNQIHHGHIWSRKFREALGFVLLSRRVHVIFCHSPKYGGEASIHCFRLLIPSIAFVY